MAHGDYDCCAVCDSKQHYAGGDSATKEEICAECIESLVTQGVMVFNVEQLLAWMRSEEPSWVINVLTESEFSTCYYMNDVDAEYAAVKDRASGESSK